MGGFGKKKSTTKPTTPGTGGGGGTAPDLATVVGKTYGLSKEFTADNPTRMPSPTDTALLAAARLRRELMARSGRESTRLVGTSVYANSFLGSTG